MNKEEMEQLSKEDVWKALREPVGYNNKLRWYIEKSKNCGQITNELSLEIITIVDKFYARPNWCGMFVNDLEDMKQDALTHVCTYILRSNSDNPFAFITTLLNDVTKRYLDRRERQI